MKTRFGFELTENDRAISGGFLQSLLSCKQAKQVCTLIDTLYVTTVPDATKNHDEIICRVFKDYDGMFYCAMIDYDSNDLECMYNLHRTYTITPTTYKKIWAAYMQQVEQVRDNLDSSVETCKAFTNDLFGESFGLYSMYWETTGRELPTVARKFSRLLGNFYKFLYMDDRV